jgi:tRNA pseudouridine55 synthase
VLAEDIGRAVGVGAHLAALRRTAAGDFTIGRSVTLESLEAHIAANTGADLLISMNEAVAHLPQIEASDTEREKIGHGGRIFREDSSLPDGESARISGEGELLAIARYSAVDNSFQPTVVFM